MFGNNNTNNNQKRQAQRNTMKAEHNARELNKSWEKRNEEPRMTITKTSCNTMLNNCNRNRNRNQQRNFKCKCWHKISKGAISASVNRCMSYVSIKSFRSKNNRSGSQSSQNFEL